MAKNIHMQNERLQIVNTLIGPDKIQSIQTQMSPKKGGLVQRAEQSPEGWIDQRFGQFGPKILAVSDGAERLGPLDFTALGGWCAIRTADLLGLQRGVFSDPQSGEKVRYSDPTAVADWIQRAVSIDQVTEAIGIYTGSNYAAISEEKLWAERVENTLVRYLDRPMTGSEETRLTDAMKIAEERRFLFTERYLQFVTGNDISLTRVVDRDIYNGLLSVRDQMLDTAGVTLQELLEKYPDEKTTSGYSIVWGMYTGPYLALLQGQGYVKTPNGLIVEPWWHATSETRSKKLVNQNIFTKPINRYLSPNGLNANLGYVAFADTMAQNGGQRVREAFSINEIPNPENYRQFIEGLSIDPDITSVSLGDNPAFVWGANLLPFGETAGSLRCMITLKEEYQRARKQLTSGSRDEAVDMAQALKSQYQTLIGKEAVNVLAELERMMAYVFEGKQ